MSYQFFHEHWLEAVLSAGRDIGLKVDDVRFAETPEHVMLEFLSHGALRRMSHPRFGGAYLQAEIMDRLNLMHIFEVVEPDIPPVIRLLETNSLGENISVAAHALGHVHLNRHNCYAREMERWRLNNIGYHQRFVDRCKKREDEDGDEVGIVEATQHRVLSILHHVDWNRRNRFSSPPDPEFPEKDLIWFLAHYSSALNLMQREILLRIREDAMYFYFAKNMHWMHEDFSCYVQGEIIQRLAENYNLPSNLYHECMNLLKRLTNPQEDGNPTAYSLRAFAFIRKQWDAYHAKWEHLALLAETKFISEEVSLFHQTVAAGRDVVIAMDDAGTIIATRFNGHERVFDLAGRLENDVAFFESILTPAFLRERELIRYVRSCEDHLPHGQKSCKNCRESPRQFSTHPELVQLAMMGKILSNYPAIEVTSVKENGVLVLKQVWHEAFQGKRLNQEYLEHTLKDIAMLWGARVLLHTCSAEGASIHFSWDKERGFQKSGTSV